MTYSVKYIRFKVKGIEKTVEFRRLGKAVHFVDLSGIFLHEIRKLTPVWRQTRMAFQKNQFMSSYVVLKKKLRIFIVLIHYNMLYNIVSRVSYG